MSQAGSEEMGAAWLFGGLDFARLGQRISHFNRPGQAPLLLESPGKSAPSNSTVSSAAVGFLFWGDILF